MENPYQAPSAALIDPTRPGPGGDFTVGEAFKSAWEGTWSSVGAWLPGILVGVICIVLSALTIIGYFVLVPVFGWGFVKLYLNVVDGKADFADIFSGFHQFGKALGRMLLIGLLFAIIGVLCSLPTYIGIFTGSDALTTFGQVFGSIAQIFVTLRFYFAPFIVVDQDRPVMEAMGESWDISKGKGLKIFLLVLLCFPIALGGMVALIIGIFPAAVIMYSMFASAYRQIYPRQTTQ